MLPKVCLNLLIALILNFNTEKLVKVVPKIIEIMQKSLNKNLKIIDHCANVKYIFSFDKNVNFNQFLNCNL